jgi:hypothetical protein
MLDIHKYTCTKGKFTPNNVTLEAENCVRICSIYLRMRVNEIAFTNYTNV